MKNEQLLEACRFGNQPLFTDSIDSADVNHQNEAGEHALYLAVTADATEFVRRLLDKQANIFLAHKTKFFAIYAGFEYHKSECLKIIFTKMKVNIPIQYFQFNREPVSYVCYLLELAIFYKRPELVAALIEQGADPNLSTSDSRPLDTMLCDGADYDLWADSIWLLQQKGAKTSRCTQSLRTVPEALAEITETIARFFSAVVRLKKRANDCVDAFIEYRADYEQIRTNLKYYKVFTDICIIGWCRQKSYLQIFSIHLPKVQQRINDFVVAELNTGRQTVGYTTLSSENPVVSLMQDCDC